MLGTVLYGPRDVRFEERDTPTIIKPTMPRLMRVQYKRAKVGSTYAETIWQYGHASCDRNASKTVV